MTALCICKMNLRPFTDSFAHAACLTSELWHFCFFGYVGDIKEVEVSGSSATLSSANNRPFCIFRSFTGLAAGTNEGGGV